MAKTMGKRILEGEIKMVKFLFVSSTMQKTKMLFALKRLQEDIIGVITACPEEKKKQQEFAKVMQSNKDATKEDLAVLGMNTLFPMLCKACQERIQEIEGEYIKRYGQ